MNKPTRTTNRLKKQAYNFLIFPVFSPIQISQIERSAKFALLLTRKKGVTYQKLPPLKRSDSSEVATLKKRRPILTA
jgi:hypothetical protein